MKKLLYLNIEEYERCEKLLNFIWSTFPKSFCTLWMLLKAPLKAQKVLNRPAVHIWNRIALSQ